jgi:WD40 repeat protein
MLLGATVQAAEETSLLAGQARNILKTHCYRCHGQGGMAEGGMNYLLDRDQLVARRKVIPGSAEQSPLYKKVASGKMPPADESPRPSAADLAILKRWIDTGAASDARTASPVATLSEAEVFQLLLADLDKMERRSRRFQRYFTLVHLANAGRSEDELQTYRLALAKLVNSLSWHPRIVNPQPIDPGKTILRIDLRDYFWDANLWNRILNEYPYGILSDTATAKACYVATGTKMPTLRADWFVATASRPPLYHDLLQLPSSASELERLLRVDVTLNLQQERAIRLGFNGSGVSKNNRLIERHDAVHGAYWKSYDFEAVPQSLVERSTLIPDRRNLFAYPLGPGFVSSSFQHAGGEIIYHLPNGLQAYMLVTAEGLRVDKAPSAIVSDPKRPDRAVENGISCMTCHTQGIIPKTDQIRPYVEKNPQAFSKADAELILALYPPEARARGLMEEDADRYHKALEKTGGRVNATEPVSTTAIAYEAELDLRTAAAELGVPAESLRLLLSRQESLTRNLGSLMVPGGSVQRQVWVDSFADLVREARVGVWFQPALAAVTLPDALGERDPLEGLSSEANSMVLSPDGRTVLIASADKTVRLWDVELGREIRRFIGHTASVWSVAFSPDGRRALSGGADQTVRLWDVATGRELRQFDGHTGLVTCLAFAPDGRWAVSIGYDHALLVWDLESGRLLRSLRSPINYVNSLAFSPDGRHLLVGGERTLRLLDPETGKEVGRFEGHSSSVTQAVFSSDGTRIASASDDRTIRVWDAARRVLLRPLIGHTGAVKAVAFSPDGRFLLSAGADQTVRLWEVASGKELGRFARHQAPVILVGFSADGRLSFSGSRDSAVLWWNLSKALAASPTASTAQSSLELLPVKPRED